MFGWEILDLVGNSDSNGFVGDYACEVVVLKSKIVVCWRWRHDGDGGANGGGTKLLSIGGIIDWVCVG